LSWITNVISNMWRPKRFGSSTFYPIVSPDVFGEIKYIEYFNSIPELNAVINLKARCFSNGRLKTVNQKGEEVDAMPEVLKAPNFFQDQKEFMRQSKIYHEIWGNEYLYGLFPVGFNWDRAKAIYTLPPNLITQEYTENQPFWVWAEEPKGISYSYEMNGYKHAIDGSQILHMNDNNVSMTEPNASNVLRGESKLKGLRAALKNIHMAYESRGVILKYRGALGILSNQSTDGVGAGLPLEEKEIKDIQDKYSQYGGLDGQFQAIITSANLRWQQMSVNPDKLGLFQETEEDFNKILDAFGVPSEMFTRQKGATFENQNQARKSIYENTIIPEANEWCMGLNSKFFPDGKIKIVMDYSHLPVFQEDIKLRSETINTMVNYLSRLRQDQQITDEEYREELFKMGVGDGKPIVKETVEIMPEEDDNI